MKTVVVGFRSDFSMDAHVWQRLKDSFQQDYHFYSLADCTDSTLKDTEIFIGWPSDDTLKKMPHLHWLQLPSAGANNFSENPNVAQEVIVTNASGVFNTAGAEHIVALMLAFTRQLKYYAIQTANHQWQRHDVERQLEGSTVTIIGLGNIGQATAKRLDAFGAHIIGVKRSLSACPPYVQTLFTINEIQKAVAGSDYVVNILPFTEETAHLFDATFFASCKRGAIFINAGRGASVVQQDLVSALKSGQIGGAGLDVTDPEPLPDTDPLWTFDNVLITSHSLGLSPSKDEKFIALLVDNLQRYRDRQPLQNKVNRRLGY